MAGRDPHEPHRTATPLELLFDLTFVVAFGMAGNEFAHLIAEGHVATGIMAYAFAVFGICWAWINYSWFSSAYDTDDWLFRVLTMVQMVGVVIFALGLPDLFKSLDAGTMVDNRVMVFGYVVMRLGLVALWLRAARHDPARRRTIMAYVVTLLVAQAIWTGIIFIDLPIAPTIALITVPMALELSGPYLAEQRGGTPWHAHHIAERYGLLTIIALGEGVIGTVASVAAIVAEAGWSVDAVLVAMAGVGLTFAMWWIYFAIPSAEVLHRYRERSFFWGYGHIVLFAAIAATGAGLHVAAYFIEHKAHIGAVGTVLSVAIPVLIYIACVFLIYARLVRIADPFHKVLFMAACAVIAASVACAWAGLPMTTCLAVLMLAPWVMVVGHEVKGRHHIEQHLVQLKGARTLH